MPQDPRTKEIARKVRSREQFLEKIIGPVMKLTQERGEEISYSEHSCHTHVVIELRNFGGFTFKTDTGQTMFGGNTVKVWHHPNSRFREGGLGSAWDEENMPVLEVDFQLEGEFRVRTFNEEINWQRALHRVLKNQVKIAEKIGKARKKAEIKLQKMREGDQENERLFEKASKLGVTPR